MNLSTKLAAALLALGDIPYSDAKKMTAQQIISLYDFDHHPIRKSEGGIDAPWNLVPRLRSEHKAKTLRDIIEIAKNKRVEIDHLMFLARMRMKGNGAVRASRWPKRKLGT